MRRLVLAGVAALLVACGGAPSAITLHAADKGLLRLADARYRIDWNAPGCSFLRIDWIPTSAGAVATEIPVSLPAGSVTFGFSGDGYLNRTADCDVVVTLTLA